MARSRPGSAATAAGAVVILLLVVVVAVRGALDTGGGSSHAPTTVSTGSTTGSTTGSGSGSGSGSIAQSTLDPQEAHTLAEVRAGPPYDYPRNDGVTYHNNNGALPRESDGWYREFTVVTPGESDRGPRRVVVGHDGAVYLTVDHYDTFRRVRLGA